MDPEIFQTMVDIFYPVGRLYASCDKIASPADFLGGKWDKIYNIDLSNDSLYSQEIHIWRRIG